jgi:hypothetical protein
VPPITTDQRRRRLARRHRLLPPSPAATVDPAAAVDEVAAALVALHASDPATVYLSTVARVPDAGLDDIERGLYATGGVLRILGMRRTLFVVPIEVVPLIHSACTRKIAATEHRRLVKMVDDAGVGGDDPEGFVVAVKAKVGAALEERGEALGRELAADVDELRTKIAINPDKPYGGEFGLTTQVLSRMAMDGTIVRTRPTGSWLSGQYRYAPMPVPLRGDELPAEEAAAALLTRYLARYGPATLADCSWWTGWTLRQTRTALADVGALEVELDGAVGYVLPDDGDPAGGDAADDTGEPWVALLPALDPTVMGWSDRDWYLGAHRPRLFDRNGNAGPTVWADGRVVGGWGQTAAGEVRVELLEDVGSEARRSIDERTAELASWLNGTVVKPRFATPLQRQIATS